MPGTADNGTNGLDKVETDVKSVSVDDAPAAAPKATPKPEIARKSSDIEATDDSTAPDEQKQSRVKDRRVSVSVRALTIVAVIVGLIAALGVMTWLYLGAKTRLDDETRRVDDNKRAEQIALDYSVDAAVMDFRDLGPWKKNLVKGTTAELNAKLTKAATAMEQIVLPLQWISTAKPIAAKVRSSDKGAYVVDAFVSVMTKTVQAADSLQSTATYSVTVDSNNAWQISDVGGIAAVVGDK